MIGPDLKKVPQGISKDLTLASLDWVDITRGEVENEIFNVLISYSICSGQHFNQIEGYGPFYTFSRTKTKTKPKPPAKILRGANLSQRSYCLWESELKS